MQAILLNLFLLAVGFLLLVKGADYFIDGATSIALKFHIPMIVIGLTVAAFGTSLPEAAISINAAFKENAGISVGNVIGSQVPEYPADSRTLSLYHAADSEKKYDSDRNSSGDRHQRTAHRRRSSFWENLLSSAASCYGYSLSHFLSISSA